MNQNFLLAPLLLAATLTAMPVLAQDPNAPATVPAPNPAQDAANSVWLDSLDLSSMTVGWGAPRARKSSDNNPITLGGKVYAHGVGTHAESEFTVALHGAATRFTATVGVDDEKKGAGSVTFEVMVDGKQALKTPVLHGGDAPVPVSVDLTGAKTMVLVVGDGGDGIDSDHADWADAQITLAAGATAKPEAAGIEEEPPRLVIPPDDPHPAIHGPRIIGSTPGRPFLFRIPATGDGPLTFKAEGLPAGLVLDGSTGIISGSLAAAGTTKVKLTVSGPEGSASRGLTVVGGDHQLALTPPLGWNSWNVWGLTVNDARVRAAADEFISSGLASHGYAYVNIDDGWEAPARNADGTIAPNQKFPDLKATADYVHSKGLRFGIYSSPGPRTCGGYLASYQHEDQDAQSYANWGVDYLKYDWCSYSSVAQGDHSLAAFQKPYQVMRAALDKTNRDIVFSFCQYGMGDVWTWGQQTGGNSWRTTGDIGDRWNSVHGIYESQNGHEAFAGPGHWNDPDMLMVGYVGFGNEHPTHLKPNEQILHISMWSMLSSPLLIGCDLTKLDPFTLALLSNDEIIDIDQDPLGKPAGRVSQDGSAEVWARPLFDGTHAAALLNTGAAPETVTVTWDELGTKGKQPVRDLWLHKDLGSFEGSYAVEVPAHGAVVLKVGKANPGA